MPQTGRQTTITLTFTPTANVESPVNPKARVARENKHTSQFATERPVHWIQTPDLGLLWGDSVNHWTIVRLISNVDSNCWQNTKISPHLYSADSKPDTFNQNYECLIFNMWIRNNATARLDCTKWWSLDFVSLSKGHWGHSVWITYNLCLSSVEMYSQRQDDFGNEYFTVSRWQFKWTRIIQWGNK